MTIAANTWVVYDGIGGSGGSADLYRIAGPCTCPPCKETPAEGPLRYLLLRVVNSWSHQVVTHAPEVSLATLAP